MRKSDKRRELFGVRIELVDTPRMELYLYLFVCKKSLSNSVEICAHREKKLHGRKGNNHGRLHFRLALNLRVPLHMPYSVRLPETNRSIASLLTQICECFVLGEEHTV